MPEGAAFRFGGEAVIEIDGAATRPMRVGGKPRVYWLTMTVLPSALMDTFTGSTFYPCSPR